MHEVLNFAGGLVPNAAYTKARNSTAHDWNNLRVTDQGFLEVRNGHTRIYDGSVVSEMFTYKNLMLAVTSGRLKWARVEEDDTDITFNDFTPDHQVNTTNEYAFKALSYELEESILFSNGPSLFVIDLKNVFATGTSQQDPVMHDFYLPPPTDPVVTRVIDGTDDDDIEGLRVDVKVQSFVESDGVSVAVSTSINTETITSIHTLKSGVDITDIAGNKADREEYRTRVRVTSGSLQAGIKANPTATIAVYFTEPYDPDDDPPGTYYKFGEIDLEDGETYFEWTMPLEPHDYIMDETLIDSVHTPAWKMIEVDNVRAYATDDTTNRLWVSYFDGINNRLFRSFNDYIPLPTGGEQITGLKFLGESGWLIVYTSQRIIIVAVDPNPELIEVVGIYGSLENDEYIGCIAPKSLVSIGRYHYFLGGDRRVYRFDGRQPKWLSSKVQPILREIQVPVPFEPVSAHAVAHEGYYYLSYPSNEDQKRILSWRGEDIEWRDNPLQWRSNEAHVPHATLVLDTERNLWYRDRFGVSSFQKGATGRLYGIIDGSICSLYDGDNSDLVWLWQSNRILMNDRQLIHNVSVKTQEPASLDVRVETEEGLQRQELDITEPNDYWGQRAGMNLRGRTLDVTISGQGPIEIDRLAINERPRRANLR